MAYNKENSYPEFTLREKKKKVIATNFVCSAVKTGVDKICILYNYSITSLIVTDLPTYEDYKNHYIC